MEKHSRHSDITINDVGVFIIQFRLSISPSETSLSNVLYLYLLLIFGNFNNTNTTSCKLH